MGVLTLFRYLLGSRAAILQIAANPWAAPLGFVFVLSAGLAREYDGADLLHEPWHILLPIPASLVTSFLLFCLTFVVAYSKDNSNDTEPKHPPFWRAFWMFLGLFWLTAPLAWFYAIPYERFLSAEGATVANLYTLALVAVWRVALMCRVLTVLMGFQAWQSVALVFLLGDAEAFLAGFLSPVPLIEVMGGMRYTGSQLLLRNFSMALLGWSCPLFPVALFAAILAAKAARPVWSVLRLAPPTNASLSRGLKILACCSLLVWVVVLPFTQPEQILRRRVEALLSAGDLQQAVTEMSAREVADFPPHWDPPPYYYGPRGPNERPYQVLEVLDLILQHPTPDWVRHLYVTKFTRFLYCPYMQEDDVRQSIRLLQLLPERDSILNELKQDPEYHHGSLRYFMEEQEKQKAPDKAK
jgi:hypothetical protein